MFSLTLCLCPNVWKEIRLKIDGLWICNNILSQNDRLRNRKLTNPLNS